MGRKAAWKRLPLGSKAVGTYVLHELAKVVKNDPGVKIHGPLQFSSESDPFLKRMVEFRASQYKKGKKYLTSQWQATLEDKLKLNARSIHFCAEAKGNIVAALRVTPPPYETAKLSPELASVVQKFPKFLELGRLVVDSSVRGMGLGKKVCYKAMLYSVQQVPFQGFIAICQKQRADEFRRFGLKSYHNRLFEIPSRPGTGYRFMWADWKAIIWTMAGYYGKKRVKNLICTGQLNRWKPLESTPQLSLGGSTNG